MQICEKSLNQDKYWEITDAFVKKLWEPWFYLKYV